MPTTRPHPHLCLTREGAVLQVRLDNPARRNAQTPTLWLALAQIAENLDPEVRVVILSGEGPSFSAGLDRAMLSPGGIAGEPDMLGPAVAGDAAGLADQIAPYQRGFTAWRECSALVVAAVHGHAIGAGFQLALGADLRVLAEDAQLAMAEVTLGLIPDLGGTRALTRLVGPERAMEICVTGRTVGAQEAVAMGLATLAVPADRLQETVQDLTAAVLQAPAATVRELLPLMRGALDRSADEQLAAERQAQSRLLVGLAQASRSAR
ncbi:enoyl-CoA hydratase/isomerase family protein [Gephyromycinifex aptenodytis]|uniref:enoyl-CoA hydratase/isomerase family protein n=1 Tax=Gephyromycinifex aptenodytis TaxID=2716227 RepID=UPI001447AC07|nr:enoyl-CoA hydratase/isomerase family protein [Gephyromycinifex aptenodytis]